MRASVEFMFDTDLRLSLQAKKSQIDSFMNSHQDLLGDYGFNNGIAVIAKLMKSIQIKLLTQNVASPI